MPLWGWLVVGGVVVPVITAIAVLVWYAVKIAGLFGKTMGGN